MKEADGAVVDAYIARQPAHAQPVLQRVRRIIRKALPGAEETLSYQIPTYRLHGRYVVHFAGWKQHWSLYPVTDRVRTALGPALASYEVSKGTLRFPLADPVPARLVERIVRALARVAEAPTRGRAARRVSEQSPERRVEQFIGRYSPEVARAARAARSKVRKLLPGAFELVYDNYNALALAFSPTEKLSDVVLSVALYPRWVSLFFARGAALPDPDEVLRGSGSRIRHVVLQPVSVIDTPPVRALIRAAIDTHPKRVSGSRGRTIIKSVSARQRPRRPGMSARQRDAAEEGQLKTIARVERSRVASERGRAQ